MKIIKKKRKEISNFKEGLKKKREGREKRGREI